VIKNSGIEIRRTRFCMREMTQANVELKCARCFNVCGGGGEIMNFCIDPE
jgi:hypothetical protein